MESDSSCWYLFLVSTPSSKLFRTTCSFRTEASYRNYWLYVKYTLAKELCVCFFEGILQTHVVWLSWSTSYFFQLFLPPSVHKKQIQPQMIHVCVSCFCVATSEGVFIINLHITRFKLAPQKMWHVSFPEASKKCGSPSHRSEQNRIGLLGGYSLTNSSVFFSGSCKHSYNSQQWRAPTGAGRPSCLDTKVPQCAVADHHWLLHGLASGGIYHAHGAKSPPTPTSPRVAALTAGSVPFRLKWHEA